MLQGTTSIDELPLDEHLRLRLRAAGVARLADLRRARRTLDGLTAAELAIIRRLLSRPDVARLP